MAPVGKAGGHPAYRLRDAFLAVQRQQQPDAMSPFARLALAKAVLAEDQIRTRRGELIERYEVERETARILQVVAHWADTTPDILERDAGLSTSQTVRLERTLDAMREQLYIRLTEGPTDDEETEARRDQGAVRPSNGGDEHDHPGARD